MKKAATVWATEEPLTRFSKASIGDSWPMRNANFGACIKTLSVILLCSAVALLPSQRVQGSIVYGDTTNLSGFAEFGIGQPGSFRALEGSLAGSFRLSEGTAVLHSALSGTATFNAGHNDVQTSSHSSYGATTEFTIDTPQSLFVRAARTGANFRPDVRIVDAGTGDFVAGVSLNYGEDRVFDLSAGNYRLEFFYSEDTSTFPGQFLGFRTFSQTFEWGIGGFAGEDFLRPILPTIIDPDSFVFDTITDTETRFYDPVVAEGYAYSTEGTPFASVMIPTALPGGDSVFELVVDGNIYELLAGVEFDLTSINANGISQFEILGIDPAEGLDPNDPTAFVTGLSFTQAGQMSSFEMSPIAFSSGASVPEPATIAIWSMLGMVGVAFYRRSRRLK